MFKTDIDVELLSKVIEYNHLRYEAFTNNLPFIPNKDYERILTARYQKRYRIKRRLVYLLSRYNYIWFCTFTYSDKYINKSDRTKRDLIKSVLSTHDFKYILNVDYGAQNKRQHFHCILATNENVDVNQYFQSFYSGGFSLSIQCKRGYGDFQRLSKYINTLTNHCIKASTNRQRIVYNFKGYDLLFPSFREQTLAYLKDMSLLWENVSLLDKANITGNFDEIY